MELAQDIIVTLVGSFSAWFLASDKAVSLSNKDAMASIIDLLHETLLTCFDRFDASKTDEEREKCKALVLSNLSRASAKIQRLEISSKSKRNIRSNFISLKRELTGSTTEFENSSTTTLPRTDLYFAKSREKIEEFTITSGDIKTPAGEFMQLLCFWK